MSKKAKKVVRNLRKIPTITKPDVEKQSRVDKPAMPSESGAPSRFHGDQLLKVVGELAKPEGVTLPVDITFTGYMWVTVAFAAHRMKMGMGEYIAANLDWDNILDDGVNEFSEVPRKRAKSN